MKIISNFPFFSVEMVSETGKYSFQLDENPTYFFLFEMLCFGNKFQFILPIFSKVLFICNLEKGK